MRDLNSASFAEPITSEKSERIIQAISRVTDAIAWLFCHFVQGKVIIELMQRSVAKYAWVQMQNTHAESRRTKKVSLTRLTMFSGLDSRTITKILKNPVRATEEHICPEAAILSAWFKDPSLRDSRTGEVMDIPIHGPAGTLEGLVHRYAGRGVSVQFVLDRLERHGNVKALNKLWVRLIDPNWALFEEGEDTFLYSAIEAIVNVSKSIKHNLVQKQNPDNKWVERRKFSYHIPVNKRDEAEKALNELLVRQWHEAGALLRSFESSDRQADSTTESIGAGYYFWRDQSSDMNDSNNQDTFKTGLYDIIGPWRKDSQSFKEIRDDNCSNLPTYKRKPPRPFESDGT